MERSEQKKRYQTPKLITFGDVAELTGRKTTLVFTAGDAGGLGESPFGS